MATKEHCIADPNSCLNKAAPDEPIFVLRANDPIAASVVRIWASLSAGYHPRTKAGRAWVLSLAMEQWREAKGFTTIAPVKEAGFTTVETSDMFREV